MDCFLTHTGTDKNLYIVNKDGTNKRVSRHIAFNEVHVSSTSTTLPPMAVVLQQAKYRTTCTVDCNIEIKMQLLHRDAVMPQKVSVNGAGYDISCINAQTIPPETQMLIKTGLAIEISTNHFGKLKSRSGLALKHNVHIKAGTIDSDYRGETKVLLSNDSPKSLKIHKNMRIAQLIIFELSTTEILQTDTLTNTARNKKGFGSTGTHAISNDVVDDITTAPTTAAAAQITTLSTNPHQVQHNKDDDHIPYNIVLSDDPFGTVPRNIKG